MLAADAARRLSRFERAQIDRQVRHGLTDWQGLLTRHTPAGAWHSPQCTRGAARLRTGRGGAYLHVQRRRGTRPAPHRSCPALSGLFNSYGGPNGIRTVVGQDLAFEIRGVALRQ